MIFIDAGPLLARYHGRDQYHERALETWDRVNRLADICVTSNLVLSEVFTLLGRRMGYAFAAERAQMIYHSDRLTIIRSTQEEELRALEFFTKFADQNVSFTDCISFAIMHKRRIHQVFSFDRHFTLAGFQLI